MVFFNYATMQMAAKIVYYGPGLCGKTTNLHVIYGRTAPTARGEMVSLETETDRTLFFDLLPIDVGVIGGFKTRLQLYTVPGQVFYNTTRKLVLKGVDGIVFVADSQRPMLEPNKGSFRNLRENLAEIGVRLEEVPLVLQYNKRDLANILSVEELGAALNPDGLLEAFESSAANGTGVFETLKGISKLTLRALRSRMSGDVRRPAVFAAPATPSPSVSAPVSTPVAVAARPLSGVFPAHEPSAVRSASPPSATLDRLARFSELARQQATEIAPTASNEPPASPSGAEPEALEAPFVASPAEADTRPDFVVPPAPSVEEAASDISFGESASAAPPSAEPAVKHVKVRSSVDILSELDKLRKISTQKASAGSGPVPRSESGSPRASGASIDDLLASNLNHKKDVTRSFDLTVPRQVLGRSRQVTIELKFSDGAGSPLQPESSFSIDLSSSADLQKLLLSLRFNVQAE
jgi:signal recognition particle receptor subunit beta